MNGRQWDCGRDGELRWKTLLLLLVDRRSSLLSYDEDEEKEEEEEEKEKVVVSSGGWSSKCLQSQSPDRQICEKSNILLEFLSWPFPYTN